MHIFLSQIIISGIFLLLLFLLFRLRVKKLKEYHSPLVGRIVVWEKYNKERLLTTNGFSQGVSVGDKSINKSYWHYQAEEIIKHCKNKTDTQVLWLGLGAGTGPHLVAGKNPSIQQTVIEFDPVIIQAAKEYFDLMTIPSLTIIQSDAYQEIEKLHKAKKKFDTIVVDIYTDDDPQNGKSSSTKEFLKNITALLKQDSFLMFNRLAHKEDERKRTKELIKLLGTNFTTVRSTFIKDSRGYQNEVITVSGNK